eukprot:TRINITY_DN15257_c0_g1_i1.p1 TRINITY_DN15257_c0_g1~~TRINITY_DN15257_c0_g1_i1.p1  ORF type:complete len:1049 (+),score=136.23 TRINITY_DN15257_c0_g1_i1:3-3149(+)
MSTSVIFAHFFFSALAALLRRQSRPCVRGVRACVKCIRNCCRSCCRRVDEQDSAMCTSTSGLKWYWFHLAMQVGFAVREFMAVSHLNGWHWELVLVHAATWCTVLVVSKEVWNYSKVRHGGEETKRSLDGLLDMLLLPLNIVFFCSLCVRVLKLQPASQLRSMVAVIVDSADIYEAFALWSVLRLFVKVAERIEGHNATFRSFGELALKGVISWVIIQLCAVVIKLVLQGLIAVYAPTLCYNYSQSCTSCEEWFESTFGLALSSLSFMLCSFAIAFVLYFERAYAKHLETIDPTWKFVGVKGIVSVTYTQYIIIKLLASPRGWNDTWVYLLHCLLYAAWMPVLAIVHMKWAYPCYRCNKEFKIRRYDSWEQDLEFELDNRGHERADYIARDGSDQVIDPFTEPPNQNSFPLRFVHRSGVAAKVQARWLREWLKTLDDPSPPPSSPPPSPPPPSSPSSMQPPSSPLPSPEDLAEPTGSARRRVVNEVQSRNMYLFYLALACFSCVASTWLLVRVVPPSDSYAELPLWNKTCTQQGDLARFLEKSNLHFTMRDDTLQKWSPPNTAGAWLPYCSTAQLACDFGYVPTLEPSVQCSATGMYQPSGSCNSISCGYPKRLPHAQPRTKDLQKQNFSLGVIIRYDCDTGYRGSMQAVCNPNKSWTWSGNCKEITCDAPPNIPHARPVLEPDRSSRNISTGTVVRYQCDDMFKGTPTAACGDEGRYVTAGRCKRECGPPPFVPHAAPNFSNDDVYKGWFEGTRCPYTCDFGFEGYVTALCGADGNYTVTGECRPASCKNAAWLPDATPHMDDIRKQNFSVGATIHYDCAPPRFQGKIEAVCNFTGRWVVHGNCSEVHCGQPPPIQNAEPDGGARQFVFAGTVIRYQCKGTFNGTPTATCGADEMYVTQGRCTKECGSPPNVPNGSPAIDNALLSAGWLAGMGVKYRCDPGFEGSATAVCGEDGKFNVQGLCKTAAAIETSRLYGTITGLRAAVGIESFLLLVALFLAWQTGCLLGLMSSMCQRRRGTATPATASHELSVGLPGLARPLAEEAAGDV